MDPLRFEEKVFKGLNVSKESFDKNIYVNCQFENCNFIECSFVNAQFCDCTFKKCFLSLVNIENCRLQNVLFDECKVVGLEFYKCNKRFFSINFKCCILMNCNYSDLEMNKSSFQESTIKECYFTDTKLKHSDFSKSDLQKSIFHNCDLSHADFRDAINYAIDPQTNNIKKGKYSLPNVTSLLNYFDINIS